MKEFFCKTRVLRTRRDRMFPKTTFQRRYADQLHVESWAGFTIAEALRKGSSPDQAVAKAAQLLTAIAFHSQRLRKTPC